MTKTINIIGAGRLGKTIARLIVKKEVGLIQDILNSNLASGQRAREFIGSGKVCHEIRQFRPADIFLITTPDNTIEKICNLLVREHKFKSNSIIIHCSGALSSDVLQQAKNIGCFTASIHPIKSFADAKKSVKTFVGTFCSYEGDAEAFDTVAKIFESIGGIIFTIDKDKKPLYHAAAVFCCNYLVTLSYIANKCCQEAGINKGNAKQIVHNLMQNTLNNLKLLPHEKALTGPIARANLDTLKQHKKALKDFPDLKHLYEELGQQTILFAEHDGKTKELLQQEL